MLERFFRRSVRNRETAEDLMQETFARALRGTYSDRGHKSRTWLWQIAKRLLIDASRRKTLPTVPLEPWHTETSPADAALLHQEERRDLCAAIGGLTPSQRDVVLCCYAFDLSIRRRPPNSA